MPLMTRRTSVTRHRRCQPHRCRPTLTQFVNFECSMMFKTGMLVALWASVATAAQVDGILEQHNVYRCMHNADPLTYNNAMAAEAQTYADTLAASCGGLVHDATTADGENLASCATAPSPVESCSSGFDATPRWYDEVEFYVPGETGGSSDPGEQIGHFTQIVWKDTQELGCASAQCTFQHGTWTFYRTYVVCRYNPPGNYLGQYLENVEANPTMTYDECNDLHG